MVYKNLFLLDPRTVKMSHLDFFDSLCIKHNPGSTRFRDRIYLVLESGQFKIQFSTTNLSFFEADNFEVFLHKHFNLNLSKSFQDFKH